MTGSLNPLLLLTSPLGDDTLPFQRGTLHAIGLRATERLSEPFTAEITAVSTERAIDPNTLLFRSVCLTVRPRKGADRYFNGIVRTIAASGLPRRDRWTYTLEIVPRLRFLDQTADCRIFQQKTTTEILRQIFAEHRVDPVEFRLYGADRVREYTTQYNETDLGFVHRLLQESGCFYYFEHTKDAHRLIVTDRNQSFRLLQEPVHWVIHEGNNIDVFDRWTEALRTAAGSMTLQDYDPRRPSTPVQGDQGTTLPTAGANLRALFRWPAGTLDNSVAADRARFTIEADEASASLRQAHGYDPRMIPGARFLLARDPFSQAEHIDHAIQAVEHVAQDDSWIAGGTSPAYENHFSCFLQTVPWREPLSLPRPAMPGLFSAIVLGDPGEEIHADSLARIKVRLMFDHRRETTAGMAIWARIVHAWAGNGWGWQHLPRVGTEVAVAFMNGDADNPAIVGGFYNAEMQPVFPVPAMQTRQGFRSRSTLHGGTQDYSELSFDDRKNEELVLLHAQRDFQTEAERDATETIGRDQSIKVMRNHALTTQTGDISITADAGRVSITATEMIILRCGLSSITLTPGNIAINTTSVVIDAAEVMTNAANTTTDAAVVLFNCAAFTVDAGEVTLATAEFIAPIQGT